MKIRSISALLLIICLFLTFSFSSYALPVNITLQEKAEFLDTLKILAGTNGNYRLNEKLTRAEAATFAVRILGQDLHVLLNSKTYSEISSSLPGC